GTVRENLVMGKPYASDEELLAVLAKVNLLDFIDAQEGLDTFVAEGGKNLSGGQCQRLALARALLHDTPAYIFDEATSAVDVESEEIIMRLVRELAQTRTVVLISHRLANVVPSDNIYMMQAGRVVEHGTHDELIAAGGAYAALYGQQMQLEGFARSSIERPSNEGKGAFDER
ncbi:MAG: ATP-binding cassette domain-containing protein, partial [Eggerthellaceae bacterium]|nr:ATP-binding cassette domain-containing protein [Eggerthellaceae bacterium]